MRHKQHGLSLIELLVAMAIGGFLIIGAVTLQSQTRKTFSINENSARLQETARYVVGICTGPTLAGKQIHLRDDQGQTLVIARGPEYKELAKYPLWEVQAAGAQQEAQSNPFYEGGRMYYRTPGFLYAIGEK